MSVSLGAQVYNLNEEDIKLRMQKVSNAAEEANERFENTVTS
jgi:hypothetical protein